MAATSGKLVLDAVDANPDGFSETLNAFEIVRRVTDVRRAYVLVRSDGAQALSERLSSNAEIISVDWSPRSTAGYFYANWRDYSLRSKAIAESLGSSVVYHRIMPFTIRYAGVRSRNCSSLVVGPIGSTRLARGMTLRYLESLPFELVKASESLRLATRTRLRAYFDSADVILCSSNMSASRFPRALSSKIRVLTEGVDPDHYSVAQAEPSVPVILCVGRMLWWKGFECLIEALAQITDLPWDAVIVGDGPRMPRVRAAIAKHDLGKRVRLTGWIDGPSVSREFAESAICCFPSFNESVGMVNLEALASGRPVVACDWGGPSDIVTDECGILVAPTSPAAYAHGIAQALRRLLLDPSLREAMGAAGRRRVESTFTWDLMRDRLLDIYDGKDDLGT